MLDMFVSAVDEATSNLLAGTPRGKHLQPSLDVLTSMMKWHKVQDEVAQGPHAKAVCHLRKTRRWTPLVDDSESPVVEFPWLIETTHQEGVAPFF